VARVDPALLIPTREGLVFFQKGIDDIDLAGRSGSLEWSAARISYDSRIFFTDAGSLSHDKAAIFVLAFSLCRVEGFF